MKDAVLAWPEFNYFTSGYAASALPHDSALFKEGLANDHSLDSLASAGKALEAVRGSLTLGPR